MTDETQVYPPRTKVAYHPKRDGILRCDVDGSCRFLSLWERLRYMFGGRP